MTQGVGDSNPSWPTREPRSGVPEVSDVTVAVERPLGQETVLDGAGRATILNVGSGASNTWKSSVPALRFAPGPAAPGAPRI
jgi:hypothetical protein